MNRAAQGVRLFEDRVEHRREVAGRGVDDLQNLGGGGLARERFVALGRARSKLALEVRDYLLWVIKRAVGSRAHPWGPSPNRPAAAIIPYPGDQHRLFFGQPLLDQ